MFFERLIAAYPELAVTVEQLQAHLNFEERVAEPKVFTFKDGSMSDEIAEAGLRMVRTQPVARTN